MIKPKTMLNAGMTGLLLSFGGICLAGEAQRTVSNIRVDTHMIYDDYVYGASLPGESAWPEITSLTVTRVEGTNHYNLDYRVEDADSAQVEVLGMVLKEAEGANVPLAGQFVCAMSTLVEGTENMLGANIATGQDIKRVTWDAGVDLGQTTQGIYVRLLVSDGRPPLSLHFVTIPATADQPALTISRYAGFGNPAMLDNLWLWLLVKGQVRRQDNRLLGVSGAYANQDLAVIGGTITELGKSFLLEIIGNVRLATATEIQRAQEATTPGTITTWQPVRQTAGRPVKMNEFNIETDGPADFYLVRVSE